MRTHLERSRKAKRPLALIRGAGRKAMDEVKFLKSWVGDPLKTGAISPSGPSLAAKMASFVEPLPHARVVELGPGTGVVTKALFDRGLTKSNLLLIEYCESFCSLIAGRNPGLDVRQGDAYAVKDILDAAPGPSPAGMFSEAHLGEPLDAIVSSLPLITRPLPVRERLLKDAFDLLRPGAPFIQFSYSVQAPVKPADRRVTIEKSQWIWKNIPPARVWVYRRPS